MSDCLDYEIPPEILLRAIACVHWAPEELAEEDRDARELIKEEDCDD